MGSFYDVFLCFRNMFTGERTINLNDVETLLEGLNKMAVDLSKLIEEVDRVKTTQDEAISRISTLVEDVRSITEQLATKTAEAENSVDVEVINSLVEKLKLSTDNLSSVIKVEN